MIKALLNFRVKKEKFMDNEHRKLFVMVIIGSIPIAIAGFFLNDFIEKAFSNLLMVGISFLFTGLLLWLTKNKQDIKEAGLKDAFIIGLFQALAVFPGISRSGSTISAGIFRKMDRNFAAKLSFLLFIPAIIGASLFKINTLQFLKQDIPAILIGFITTIIVSYFALNWLLSIIKKRKLHYFAYYCWFIGILTLILNFVI